MRAITVRPRQPHSISLDEVPPPPVSEGAVLVRTLAIGICGTDRDIVEGDYGTAPSGEDRLIIGHESLGRVEEAPAGSGFTKGDLIVGVVRRPDPVPCPACGAGEWDMCRNGRYTERGIKSRNGYASDYFRIEPEFAIKLNPSLADVGVLMEPTSIVAKAWEQCLRIGMRGAAWAPRIVLVTGAGPIGLLAAMIGRQRGLEVHVYDHNDSGIKPELVKTLGATYHSGARPDLERIQPDIVMECTGAAPVLSAVIGAATPAGIVCLTGVSSPGRKTEFDLGRFNGDMVLENQTVFGSVNANRRHFERAVQALTIADKSWLARLITRRIPLSRWREAYERREGDIKVVHDFALQ